MKKIMTLSTALYGLIMALLVAAMTTGCTQQLASTFNTLIDHEAQEDAEDLLQEIRQAQETVQQAIMMIKEKN